MATSVFFREAIDSVIYVHEGDCVNFVVDTTSNVFRFSKDGRVNYTVPFSNIRYIREVM